MVVAIGLSYAWISLIEPSCNIVLYDVSNINDEIDADNSDKIWINISRVFKHVGFQILQSIDSYGMIPKTVTLPRTFEFIGQHDTVIAKPVVGARTIGIIVGPPNDLYAYVTAGDFRDVSDYNEIVDNLPSTLKLYHTSANYKEFVGKSLYEYKYIVQPYLTDYAEFRLYVSPTTKDIFQFAVKRPDNYLESRNKGTYKIVDVNDILTKSTKSKLLEIVNKFSRHTGCNWPVLSIDFFIKTEDDCYIIDYGIEFNMTKLTMDTKVFNLFRKWLNDKIHETKQMLMSQ